MGMHCSAKSLVLAGLGILLACGRQPGSSSSIVGRGGSVPTDGALGTATVPPSNRVAINLGETPWRYLKDRDPADAMNPDYDDTAANTREAWSSVGSRRARATTTPS